MKLVIDGYLHENPLAMTREQENDVLERTNRGDQEHQR